MSNYTFNTGQGCFYPPWDQIHPPTFIRAKVGMVRQSLLQLPCISIQLYISLTAAAFLPKQDHNKSGDPHLHATILIYGEVDPAGIC